MNNFVNVFNSFRSIKTTYTNNGKIEDIIMSYISIFEKPDDGGKK